MMRELHRLCYCLRVQLWWLRRWIGSIGHWYRWNRNNENGVWASIRYGVWGAWLLAGPGPTCRARMRRGE